MAIMFFVHIVFIVINSICAVYCVKEEAWGLCAINVLAVVLNGLAAALLAN